MKITWIGHAAVLVEGSKTVIIDPFLKNNPKAARTVESLPHLDYILVTHDHGDHFGDTVELAERDGAKVVAIYELSEMPAMAQAKEKINFVGMNIGGTYREGEIAASMTPAIHSATHGAPAGFVLSIDGKKIYHAGDTALFSDMSLIAKSFGPIDLAFLPIGGHFTMDVPQAAMAVEMLKPKLVVPIHYNTWPMIMADAEDFKKRCGQVSVNVLSPGEAVEL